MKNKIAIVTGAANGIGKSVSEKLEKQNYIVIKIDKAFNNTKENEIKLDVLDEDAVNKKFNELYLKFGSIDILINSIGGTIHSKPIENIEFQNFKETMDLNLLSVFNCTKNVVPYMKRHKWGRIVNIAAVAGRTSTFFGGVDFSASKAAVIGFTRQSAFELAQFGITVNAISPGLTMTERVENMWNGYTQEKREEILSRIPIDRASTVDEQSDTIEFLCSEKASYICGAVIDVNGAMFIG